MKYADFYWARVKPLDPTDEKCKCLVWTGEYTLDDVPVAAVGGQKITGYTLAWIVDGGMASDGPFVRTCGTAGCVAIDHIRMKHDDPYMDEMCVDERLEDGFRMLDSSEDEDLSDEEEW